MLPSNELSKLYQIISDDTPTFENISQLFKDTFSKSEQFKVGITLCILLKDNLLNIQQRIISYYILYEMKKNDKLEVNPFLPIILEMLQFSRNKTEQNFLIDFLNEQIDYTKLSVKDYLQDNTRTATNKFNISSYIQIYKDKYYKELLKCNDNSLVNNLNDHMRHIVYDRKKNDIKNIDNHPPVNLMDINSENELSFKFFEPNYMSFCPVNNINNNKIFNDEPYWLMPILKHNFIWEKQNDSQIADNKEK